MSLNLKGKIKSLICFALCAALVFAGMLSGCSTPQYAVEFGDGDKLTTAEYLAFLFNSYQSLFSYYYGIDWEQELSYGEGEDAEKLSVEQYIVRMTRDSILRQKALEDKLKEFDIKLSEEDEEEYKSFMDTVSEDQFIHLGFSKKAFGRMYKAVSYYESTLFFGLYDKGGKRAMSEDEIKSYYKENFLTYKSIEIPLVDENGSDLDEEGVKEVKDRLQGYLDLFNSEKDFDKVIDKYNKDEEDKDKEDEDGENGETEESESADEDDKDDGEGDDENGDTEDETDQNLKMIDATRDDENLVEAVRSVSVGGAKIVEFKSGGTTNVAALIYRVNPEDTKEYKLENVRERVIESAKYEEFDKEIKEYVKKIEKDFKINKTVLRRCTPKQLEKDINKQS